MAAVGGHEGHNGRAAGFLAIVIGILLGLLSGSSALAQTRRVALVVGNAGYAHGPALATTANDAALIAATLRQRGFTLVGGGAQENVGKARFETLLQQFGRAIQGANVALFYYAGHAVQIGGGNWLVPVDANPAGVPDVAAQMVGADAVLRQTDGAGTRLNLVILDACHDNPFPVLDASAGLAAMAAPEGMLIAFAAQPGHAAATKNGADGAFARALDAAMRLPGQDVPHVFGRAGQDVQHETGGAQLPWLSTAPIDGDFYFTQANAASDAIVAVTGGGMPTLPRAAPGAEPGALQERTTQGLAEPETELGLAAATGQGMPRDDAAARHWLGLAADKGIAKAQYALGVLFERGLGGARSYAEALQWYRRAADQAYPPAETAMGRFYGRGLGVARDPGERIAWYRRAADNGDAVGQWALGNLYQFGDGVERNLPTARQWFERAAGQGFVPAEVRMALMNERGIGGRQNNGEAVQWLRRAADAGDAVALNGLGAFYQRGLAVKQDYAEAMRLFRLAADKGNAMAAFNVGALYAGGLGVKTDLAQACQWFTRAADAGNPTAIRRLAQGGECKSGGGGGMLRPLRERVERLLPGHSQ